MLQISNLNFSYRDKIIFHNLNLSFCRPEIIAIIGDNGVGKTTFLKLIAGELLPDEGSIKIQGDVDILHQDHKLNQLEDSLLFQKSGGELTNYYLEQLLRTRPSVLLLDEPTNSLDSKSKTKLCQNLQKYRGLVLMVSHDRDFIDQVAHKILYVHNQTAQLFSGNYSDFCTQQEHILHQQELTYQQIQRQKHKLKQQLKVACDAANKSNHHRFDKLRDESKLIAHGKRMGAQNNAGKILRATETKLAQLPEVSKPFERKTYNAQLSHNLSHSKKLLTVEKVSKSYNQKILFQNLNFELWTGERLRISGPNGSGKSTLLKIIQGQIQPDQGTTNISAGVTHAYISQDVFDLDLAQSFLAQNSDIDRTSIYQSATTMDLSPENLQQPARELSRGQLTKLAILKLILRPVDFAMLDEITNHLDIRARENIELALQNYQGAILAVTHDEAFARKLSFTQEINLENY